MEKSLLWFVSRISLIIFSYIIIYFGINGLTSNYREGDSMNYHIPIAEAYLSGKIIDPATFEGTRFLKYSPGINEGIVAFLMVLEISINVFNIFGLVVLFIVCFYTGKKFNLNRDLSIVFAGSIVTLHTMIRWINTQVIDVWLAIWFVLLLGLLQKPEKTFKYFLFLGIVVGLLLGSKYTGPLFLAILFVFYVKSPWKYLSLKNVIAFFVPVSILGLSWYARNYIATGNPLYPQGFLWFEDAGFAILSTNVWKAILLLPNGVSNFINAIISEFGLWSIALFTPILLLSKKVRNTKAFLLIIMGGIFFIIYLFLPSDRYYNIAVSVFRYSYPAFITFILSIFLLSAKFKKENFLAIFALANMIIIPELAYKPKLLFLLLPVVLLVFYEDEVRKYLKNKVPLSGGK